MKNIIITLILAISLTVTAEPKIEVMSELMKQVNSFTTDNGIPWCRLKPWDKQDYDCHIIGAPVEVTYLVSTIHGNYNYSLIRMSYKTTEVLKGDFGEDELTFYIERRFPTKESGIMLKELWPFTRGRALSFKLKREDDLYHIVSIERDKE